MHQYTRHGAKLRNFGYKEINCRNVTNIKLQILFFYVPEFFSIKSINQTIILISLKNHIYCRNESKSVVLKEFKRKPA